MPSCRAAVVLTVLVLVGAACTRGTPVTQDGPSTSGAAAPSAAPGEPRCRELAYPCSWADVDQAALTKTDALAKQVARVMGEADGPAAMDAAEELLAARDDLAEWGVDATDHSGVMFRIEGGRPAVVSGPNAAGTAGPPSTWTLEDVERRSPPNQGRATEPSTAAVAPSGPTVTLADYRPAGGPMRRPRRALVLDPFPGESCSGDGVTGPGGYSCRLTEEGLTEGQAVAAVLGRDPSYDVALLQGSDVDPAVLMKAGEYDVVHLASHGVRACGDDIEPLIPSVDADTDSCYSAIHLGPQDVSQAQQTADQMDVDEIPAGLVYSNGGWGMTASFLNQVGGLADTIVYLSACTSADDQALDRSRLGGFVGWQDYVRVDGALNTAVRFWELMTRHGASVDTAADVLSEEGLDSTWAFPNYKVVVAHLVAESPRNLRARDVITDTVTSGEQLAVTGTVDGTDPVVLRDLTMWIDGVRNGTEDDVTVELRIDDRTVVVDDDGIPLTRYGTRYHENETFSHWRLDLEDVELPVGLTAADVDPTSPRPHTWEARAYIDEDLYTADRADPVYLGGQVVARADPGPTTFGEYLGSTEATVDLSDLYMVLPLGGGDVEGEVDVVYELDGGPSPTRSTLEIGGTFDPDTKRIEGAASSVETADDLYPMPPVDATLNGIVDLDAGTVDLVIGGSMSWWPEPIRFTADLGSTAPDGPPTSDVDRPNV